MSCTVKSFVRARFFRTSQPHSPESEVESRSLVDSSTEHQDMLHRARVEEP